MKAGHPRGACFVGNEGSILIELKNIATISDVTIEFDAAGENLKTKPQMIEFQVSYIFNKICSQLNLEFFKGWNKEKSEMWAFRAEMGDKAASEKFIIKVSFQS